LGKRRNPILWTAKASSAKGFQPRVGELGPHGARFVTDFSIFIPAVGIESVFRVGDPKKWMPPNRLFNVTAALETRRGGGRKRPQQGGASSAARGARAAR
jgi:hypothetical protein